MRKDRNLSAAQLSRVGWSDADAYADADGRADGWIISIAERASSE